MVSGFLLKASLVVSPPKFYSFLVMRRASSCPNARHVSVRSALEPPDVTRLQKQLLSPEAPQEITEVGENLMNPLNRDV